MSFRTLGLLPVAVLALAFASPARALECEGQTVNVSSTGSFTDCAGRTVSIDTFSSSLIVLSGSGPWDNEDWFSDLHVAVLAIGDATDPDLGNSFFQNDAGDFWMESSSNSGVVADVISFVANDASERVFLGDDYSWQARFTFNSSAASSADVTIDYTMDVPEPALGVVLLGGLVAVGLVRRGLR